MILKITKLKLCKRSILIFYFDPASKSILYQFSNVCVVDAYPKNGFKMIEIKCLVQTYVSLHSIYHYFCLFYQEIELPEDHITMKIDHIGYSSSCQSDYQKNTVDLYKMNM